MTRYALLCGSAPQGKMQRKVDAMYDTLIAGGWDECDIMVFPNGIDEAALVYVLTNLRMSGLGHLLIYVCTQTPVADGVARRQRDTEADSGASREPCGVRVVGWRG